MKLAEALSIRKDFSHGDTAGMRHRCQAAQ